MELSQRPFNSDNVPRPDARGARVNWGIAVSYAPGEEDGTPRLSRAFPAVYKGTCPCGEGFAAGDRVHYVAKDVLAHEGCDGSETPAPEPTTEVMKMGPREVAQARARICPRCFIVRLPSGLCGTCD